MTLWLVTKLSFKLLLLLPLPSLLPPPSLLPGPAGVLLPPVPSTLYSTQQIQHTMDT